MGQGKFSVSDRPPIEILVRMNGTHTPSRAPRPADVEATNPELFSQLVHERTTVRDWAWREFDTKYRPFISNVARRMGLDEAGTADVTQDVQLQFVKRAPNFHYDPAVGRFRSYLKTATRHAVIRHLGREQRRPTPGGEAVDHAVDPDDIMSRLEAAWESEELRDAMAGVRGSFRSEATWRMFERHVLLQHDAEDVARDEGVTVDAVYRAKARVVDKIRQAMPDAKHHPAPRPPKTNEPA